MICECNKQTLLRGIRGSLMLPNCRNADLHPRMRDFCLTFDLRRPEAMAMEVDEIAAQLAPWLPRPKQYPQPGNARREPESLAALRVARDAEIEATETGNARPDVRALVQVDFERTRHTHSSVWWGGHVRYLNSIGNAGDRAEQRRYLQRCYAQFALAEWSGESRARRVSEDSVTLNVGTEDTISVPSNWLLEQDPQTDYEAVAIEANRLVLDRDDQVKRRQRRDDQRIAQRESGRAFLEKMHGKRGRR